MRVISKKALREFWEDPKRPPNAQTLLSAWYKIVLDATWSTFGELRQMFNSADQVGNCVVFDVGHNRFRVIGRVLYADEENYLPGVVYILRVMDHKEYDENAWPGQCGCHEPPPKKGRDKKSPRRGIGLRPTRRPRRRGK